MGVADKTSAPNPRSCIKTIQETRRISFGVATPSVLRQFEITASTNIRDTPILQCHAISQTFKKKSCCTTSRPHGPPRRQRWNVCRKMILPQPTPHALRHIGFECSRSPIEPACIARSSYCPNNSDETRSDRTIGCSRKCCIIF